MTYALIRRRTLAAVAFLAIVCGATSAQAQVPQTPTISAVQSGGRVAYTYTIEPGLTGITIQEAADANFTSGVSSIGAPFTIGSYGFPKACTNFYYRAQSRNAAGASGWSAPQLSSCGEATPTPVPVAPVAPPVPSISAAQSAGMVSYTYTIQSDLTGFTIQEASDANFTVDLRSLPVAPITGRIGWSRACGNFYYRAQARNSVGTSAWSAPQLSSCSGSAPAVPRISAVQSGGRVAYTYTIEPGLTSITIQEAADANFTSGVSSIGAPFNTGSYGFPKACTNFYYRAESRNSAGRSGWSAPQLSSCTAAAVAPAGAAPAGWTLTAYQASDIAVGRNGAVWFINGGTIYQVTASGPQAVPGAARNIAVDPNGLPWVVNSSGNIFRWNGSGWTLVPGLANDIGIGANGSVWIIGTDGVPASWNGSAWVKLSGGGTKISVDPSGRPWVINAANNIWRWTGSSWQQLAGAATDISVGPDGAVYVVGGGGQIYRWDGTSNWIAETGVTGSAVAAGLGPRAWVARAGQPVITR